MDVLLTTERVTPLLAIAGKKKKLPIRKKNTVKEPSLGSVSKIKNNSY